MRPRKLEASYRYLTEYDRVERAVARILVTVAILVGIPLMLWHKDTGWALAAAVLCGLLLIAQILNVYRQVVQGHR